MRIILLSLWQSLWDLSSKGRFYYKIQPNVSFKVKYSDHHRATQTCITRLRLGKCLLNDVLYTYKVKDTNLCDFCDIKEDVTHFLLDCIDFQHLQQKIIDKFLSAGSQLTITSLLGDSKWYNDVWDYVIQSQKNI